MKILKGENIAKQLKEWGISCKFDSFTISPQVVKYKFKLFDFMKLNKIKKMAEILTSWTGQNAKISTTQGGFFVELERKEREFISLNEFANTLQKAPRCSLAIGTNTNGQQITATLEELTHLLVAGTTGGGKSIVLNNFIISLTCYNKPKNLALILIDLKQVEFSKFENLHHLASEIITEPEQAIALLTKLIDIMEQRYQKMKEINIEKNNGHFKSVCVIIDELTDLIQQAPESKRLLTRLLQKSRACGIHFIMATQSPRASILDGVMLANLPSRLALKCSSTRESILILGHGGAEKLTGKGDSIFKAQNTTTEERIQAPYLTNEQIKNIIN